MVVTDFVASLREKARSPFFFACFTAPDGRRVQRSTKQTKRKQAQAMANEWEKAARLAAETVSYTHLDVYKRQVTFPGCGQRP